MNYGFDISSIPYGTGVSRYTANLVRTLYKHLSPQESLLLYGNSLRRKSELDQFAQSINSSISTQFSYLPPSFMPLIFNQLNLNIELFTGRLSVFHTWDWYAPRTKYAKLLSTVHDLALFKYPSVAHAKIEYAHASSLERLKKYKAHIIAVSKATKKDLIELMGFNPSRITVIHNALPAEARLKPDPKSIQTVIKRFELKKPFFLMVGTLEPRKNFKNQLLAWQHYQKDFDLVIAGKPGWEKISPQKGVIFTDYVSGGDLAALYSQASILLYASLYEGFGLPILEAFFHQTPVVTSMVSSLPEVGGEACEYADPDSTDSIIQAIARALSRSNNLKKAGREQLKKFSWDDTAQKTLDLYRKLAST